MDIELVTAPQDAAPLDIITVAQQRSHMRIASTTRDADIEDAIRDAVAQLHGIGGELRRSVMPCQWALYLHEFPDDYTIPIEIPLPPLKSVDSITYLDQSGTTQTVSSSVYTVTKSDPAGLVYLVRGQSWPAILDHPRAIKITFTAGYDWTSSAGMSHPHVRQIRRAVKVLAAHLYENAEATIIEGRVMSSSKKVEFGLDFILNRLRAPLRYD